MRKMVFALLSAVIAGIVPAAAQDMLDMVDLTSDQFTKAEMSRADIEAGLAKLADGQKLDLTGKALNGLDLSGLDLRRTVLQSARLLVASDDMKIRLRYTDTSFCDAGHS